MEHRRVERAGCRAVFCGFEVERPADARPLHRPVAQCGSRHRRAGPTSRHARGSFPWYCKAAAATVAIPRIELCMRSYLAVLKDSFREALASRVLWILMIVITLILIAAAPLG